MSSESRSTPHQPVVGQYNLLVARWRCIAPFLVDQARKTARYPGRILLIIGEMVYRAWRRILTARPDARPDALPDGQPNALPASSMDPRLVALLRSPAAGYCPVGRRVLMVVATTARGGATRRLIATAEGLIERGYEVSVLVLERSVPSGPSFEEEFRKLGARFMNDLDTTDQTTTGCRISPRRARSECASLVSQVIETVAPPVRDETMAVVHAIDNLRPEIVHGWGDNAATPAGVAACLLGVPRVVLGQTSIAPVHYAGNGAAFYADHYREMLQNPNVTMVANSRAAAADYETWISLRPGSVRVVHNGILPATVRVPARSEVAAYRRSLGFQEGTPVVGSVGRFADEKDPMLWLQTAAEIARSRSDVRFLFVGFGPLRDEIIRTVAALGLEARCVVQGPAMDVGLVYAALDIFLLTSKFEALPNVLIEAQSVGIPIVSTDYRGVREALIEDVTGRIVPERSPAVLAKSVIEVIDDEAWVRRARVQGPLLVRQRFSHRRMIDGTIEVYEQFSERTWSGAFGLRRAARNFRDRFRRKPAPHT